jgi:hypothetical protein
MFRRFSAHRLVPLAFVALALLAATGTARGQSNADDDGATPAAPPSAGAAAGVGAFSPFSMSARSDTQRALAVFQGGYDSGLNASVFRAAAEVQLWGRLSVRGGGSYLGPSGQLQPDVSLKVDALRQESHGVDVAAAVGYEAQGFNLTPAVVARAAVGRTLDHTRLTANIGYGAGTRDGERYGDLRFAAMQRIARDVHLGLDSRFRIDLDRDSDEPAGEPDWEANAGPVAAVSLGRFVLTGGAGASAVKYRLVSTRGVGLYGLMGLGAVF